MPLLAPIDSATIAIVDKGRWHVVDVATGAPTAWGTADRVPGKGGWWEVRPTGVSWVADAGAVTPVWTGTLDGFATDGVAFWARVGDRIEKVGGEVTFRAPGAVVLGADPGGLAWASQERVARVGADGRQTCSVDLDTTPVAVAANADHLAVADADGILLVELKRCTVVAASTAVAAALTWSGDTLLAITAGGLQSFDTTLDAPPGYHLGWFGLDGPRPALFVGTGIYALGTSTFTALPPAAEFDASTVLTSDDHRYRVFDSAGAVLAEGDVLPLPVVAYDVWGGKAAVTDGTSVTLLGVGSVRPGGAIRAVEVLGATEVGFLADGAWWHAEMTSGKTTAIAPLYEPVRAGVGAPAAWSPVDPATTLAIREVDGGLGVVDPRSGRPLGKPMAIERAAAGRSVRASADGRMVVASGGGSISAWESATGRQRWNVPGEGSVVRVGTSVIEIAGADGQLRSLDPATGVSIDAVFTSLAAERRPGAALPAWKGTPAEWAVPAAGAAGLDPLGLIRAFAPLLEWPAPRAWGGWCGRAEVAASVLGGLPAVKERVVAALQGCASGAPPIRAGGPDAAAVLRDEACSGSLWLDGAEVSVPTDPARDTLVTTAVDRPPILADDVDVWLLSDDPTAASRWSRTVRRASLRQPLPGCLAGVEEGGAAWIGKDGHVHARGAVATVAQAMRAGGLVAPSPALRLSTRGTLRAVVPVDGSAVVLGDQLVARVDNTGKTRWAVAGGGSAMEVVGGMVIRVDGTRVRALDLEDGRTLWETAAQLVGADGDAVVLGDRGVQLSVGRDGRRRWTHAGPGRRVGGAYEAEVAGWRCRRDGKSLEPGECAPRSQAELPYVREGDAVIFSRGRRDEAVVRNVTSIQPVGRRWAIQRGKIGTWLVAEDGRVEAVLPPTTEVRADGRRLWAVVNGQVEVYEL